MDPRSVFRRLANAHEGDPEAAEVLGVSDSAVENDWFVARAWLRTKLASSP